MLHRYLLNPYTIVTCGGYSTVVLTNVSVVWALWMRLKGNKQCHVSAVENKMSPGIAGSLHIMQVLLSNVLPWHSPGLQPPNTLYRVELYAVNVVNDPTKFGICTSHNRF